MPAVLGHAPLTAEYRDRPAVIKIGPHQVTSRAILAPMAGVMDRPFRRMCRQLGAGLVVSEMVTSDTRDRKSTRLNSSHVRISYAVFCLKKKKDKHSSRQVCYS